MFSDAPLAVACHSRYLSPWSAAVSSLFDTSPVVAAPSRRRSPPRSPLWCSDGGRYTGMSSGGAAARNNHCIPSQDCRAAR